jgi:membrane protease YdiL (CAAX protease family)
MRRLLHRWFFDPWAELNAQAYGDERAWDWRPVVALILAAIDLTLHEYYGNRATFDRLFGRFAEARYYDLGSFAWWAGVRAMGYGVIPIVALLVQGEPLREYGLSVRGFRRHAWIYGALYLAVVPVVTAASFTPAFQHTYPFYKLAARSWPDLLAWEGLYALQFLVLETFFRGFLLFSLRRVMGAYAIFVMIVPYCMIHYHKPIPEVLGAVGAGVILGTLALRTGSIWFGVLIHISVAWTMDLLSLAHAHGLPPGR